MIKKALVLIDASNFKYYLWEHDWSIDWSRFKAYFEALYTDIKFIYYEGFRSKATFFDYQPDSTLQEFMEARKKKLEFFKNLKLLGFVVVTKLISRVYDRTEGKMKHKCNFDVEITIDAIDQINNYDEFILCSGDGDFVKLIKYLKGHKKRTVVIAPKKRLSNTLAKTSNRVIFLESLKTQIEKK
jgi:uncharacterized LabA/DUF88 family protein